MFRRKAIFPNKLLPCATGITALALTALSMLAQILHATGPLPSFEVSTIKPSQDAAIGEEASGEEVHIIDTVKQIIQRAYSVSMAMPIEVIGGPDWINTDMYDILGKMNTATFTASQTMSRAQKREQRQLMEQSLLADRLKLKAHFETRDQPEYALTIIKGGPKLKPAIDVPPGAYTVREATVGDSVNLNDLHKGILILHKGQGLEMIAKGMTIDAFLHALMPRPELAGRLLVDQTMLKGAYDFTLDWGPEQSATPNSGEQSDADLPPLFTAIQQQLGLKLSPSKGPGEVIVIDHIERPSPN